MGPPAEDGVLSRWREPTLLLHIPLGFGIGMPLPKSIHAFLVYLPELRTYVPYLPGQFRSRGILYNKGHTSRIP